MIPTKVVTGAVAVSTYRCAQFHHFDDELLAGHRREVIIHHAVSIPHVDAAADSTSPRLGRWGPVSDPHLTQMRISSYGTIRRPR